MVSFWGAGLACFVAFAIKGEVVGVGVSVVADVYAATNENSCRKRNFCCLINKVGSATFDVKCSQTLTSAILQ